MKPAILSFKSQCLILLACAFSLLPLSASAALGDTDNQLTKVSYSTLPGDTVQVRLSFSKQPLAPGNFTINNPARIVFDFPNTSSALDWKNKNIGIGLAQSITAVEAGDRTRIILNLVQLIPFESVIVNKDVVITLAGSRSARPSISVAEGADGEQQRSADGEAAQQPASTALHQIRNIDFRRGKQGEGKIIINISDEDIPVSTGESGNQIFVEFGDTDLPENLRQRLDVIDFATPVQYIDASQSADRVRITITPMGDYEYLAYHTGKDYTIEVKETPKEEEKGEVKDTFGFTGEKLSLNFQDIEVRAVLQLIADFTGLNMVTSDSVSGNLTLRLKNVPWDQALDIVLKTKGLAMRKAGNVIMIAPAEEVAAQEKLELEASKQIEELAPVRSTLIQVNYAKAEEIAALLEAKGGMISERGDVSVDNRTNTVLVSDTPDRLEEVRRLITALDIPVRQVMIESRIVIADDDFAKDLGTRFGVTTWDGNNNDVVFGSGTLNGSDAMVSSYIDPNNPNPGSFEIPGGSGGIPQRMNVNMPVIANNAGRIAFSILGANALIDLELSALQTEGRGEVISNPRVITSNQQPALIEQGTEIPYLEASSSGAATVAFKKAVLALEATPQITPDDRIIMDLRVKKDSVGVLFGTSGIPSIDTKEVETQVLMNNGETVVLGGVYEQVTRDDSDRVPFFADLPVVGHMFRNTRQRNEKSELLIFVTPKILKQEFTAAQ